MTLNPMAEVVGTAVQTVLEDEKWLVLVGVLLAVSIYPAMASMENLINWYSKLGPWKQFAVASILATPVALVAQIGLGGIRGITIPLAGIGILAGAVTTYDRSDISLQDWIQEARGLQLFAVMSLIPAIIALVYSYFGSGAVSPLDVYTLGLPAAGVVVLIAKRYSDA